MRISTDHREYFEQVWEFVRQVPHGKVVTYGQIAKALPEPQEVKLDDQPGSIPRLVGTALSSCPQDVPWHRVINAQGKVSSRADATNQVHLLEAEGLYFAHGRLELKEHQWPGPNAAAQPKQHQLF